MKEKIINKYFENEEEYQAYKPYLLVILFAMLTTMIFSLL